MLLKNTKDGYWKRRLPDAQFLVSASSVCPIPCLPTTTLSYPLLLITPTTQTTSHNLFTSCTLSTRYSVALTEIIISRYLRHSGRSCQCQASLNVLATQRRPDCLKLYIATYYLLAIETFIPYKLIFVESFHPTPTASPGVSDLADCLFPYEVARRVNKDRTQPSYVMLKHQRRHLSKCRSSQHVVICSLYIVHYLYSSGMLFRSAHSS